MPYIPNTPESILPRSDSKNPATTCKGLVNDGRPCRRPVSRQPHAGPDDGGYCWQHQDQAVPPARGTHGPDQEAGRRPPTMRNRTSVDTLVDRLGILDVTSARPPPKPSRPRPQANPFSAFFCCFGIPAHPRQGPQSAPSRPGRPAHRVSTERRSRASAGLPSNARPQQPSQKRDQSSRTAEYMSLIPPHTSPATASLLLAELAKPVSHKDEEGFIYMFWLTPESLSDQPSPEAVSSLLAHSSSNPKAPKSSDLLNSFMPIHHPAGNKSILLKIGRAQNVHRRLNQWTRQCGYNLSLIRYYPYRPMNSILPSSSTHPVAKVPNVHKVERLIHIEMNEKRAQHGKCAVCAKEHREWFQVKASRTGVKEVDEIIRRWVDWNVRNATGQ